MNYKALIIILILIVVSVGAGYLYQTLPVHAQARTVQMTGPSGEDMGTINLSETKAGVLLAVNLKGLTPNGEHAFHVHEVGQCDGDKNFTTAGGHYNPGGHSHGLKHPEGHHAGDMPNLKPDEKGEIANNIMNFKITLNDEKTGGRHTVFDEDGSSIIIHAGADDHMSQPSGAAGKRIACGVIDAYRIE